MNSASRGSCASPAALQARWTFDPASTVPVPAGTFVTHFGKQVHYDSANDKGVVLLFIGEGPAISTRVEQKQPGL